MRLLFTNLQVTDITVRMPHPSCLRYGNVRTLQISEILAHLRTKKRLPFTLSLDIVEI